MIKQKHTIPTVLATIITLSVLFFGIFDYSEVFGYTQIISFNALFLVPFVCTIILLGAFLIEGGSIFYSNSRMESKLSKREMEIVQLIKAGKTNPEIAQILFIEHSTVKTHINNIYKKSGIKSRQQLLQNK